MAPERRGLRRGGESQADAPRRPRPRPGPSPLPCPEASTALGAGGGDELGRARGRPWDSTSRRFGGRWVARARTDARERGRARARTPRAGAEQASGRYHAGRRPRSRESPSAERLRGVPGRPRGDSLPSRDGHPMRSPGGRPDPDGNGAREPRADPGARPRPPGQAGIGSGSRPGTRGPYGPQTLPYPSTASAYTAQVASKETARDPQAQAGGSRCPKGA